MAAGLACSALQFEVTESLAMQDEAALGVLQALRALVRAALQVADAMAEYLHLAAQRAPPQARPTGPSCWIDGQPRPDPRCSTASTR